MDFARTICSGIWLPKVAAKQASADQSIKTFGNATFQWPASELEKL